MAFSGDKTWTATRSDIIGAALRKCGAYDSANGPTTQETTDASLALNAILKEWSAEGIGIWLRQKTCLILNRGQPYYWLGPNPTNDTTNRIFHQAFAASELKEATLSASAAASATALSITDTSWIDSNRQTATKPTSTSVKIGIRLDDLTIHWTTIASTGTNTVDIAAALPSAASSGAHVYTFTNRTTRPIRALAAWRQNTDGIDTELRMIGRADYELLSNKISEGDPTQIAFSATIQEQTSSALHSRLEVWPCKNSVTFDKIYLLTEHYPDDMDGSTDTLQFPPEWTNAIIWNLAWEMSLEFNLSASERALLERQAMQKKANIVLSADEENASVYLRPEYMR